MGELVFFTGTMDSGKSTLALQIDHNHRARGLVGLILSAHDRAGEGRLSSRLGLAVDAVEVGTDLDLWSFVVDRLTAGDRLDYIVADEAQFYTEAQVESLARVADELDRNVFAFGILTDFRTKLFPGAARLVELADRIQVLQVEALCWCGERATHNARTLDGVMVVEGSQVVVGDTEKVGALTPDGVVASEPVVAYEVLCRAHHRRRVTASQSGSGVLSPAQLPFSVNELANG